MQCTKGQAYWRMQKDCTDGPRYISFCFLFVGGGGSQIILKLVPLAGYTTNSILFMGIKYQYSLNSTCYILLNLPLNLYVKQFKFY